MKCMGRIAFFVAVASCLTGYTAAAQSTPPAQNQQSPSNSSAQGQNQDQYTGVSHPPADDTIQADEDQPAPAPAPAPAPKPSAAIPLRPASPPPVATDKTAENPDYGIVTAPGSTNNGVRLETRPDGDPDDGIVSYVPDNPNQLAEGTNIRVALTQDLSTANTMRGARFEARLTGNVYKEGRVVLPAGSELRGEVVHVSQGHHLGPHATIRLRPDVVVLPNGTQYDVMAEVVESDASGTRVNEEGVIEASVRYKKDALEYGAGAGTGAAAGAVIAGPVGAGVGSLVGTSAVTAHMLLNHPEAANLPQGSVLIFSLTEPMELTAAKN
jgi:hypothetical protein